MYETLLMAHNPIAQRSLFLSQSRERAILVGSLKRATSAIRYALHRQLRALRYPLPFWPEPSCVSANWPRQGALPILQDFRKFVSHKRHIGLSRFRNAEDGWRGIIGISELLFDPNEIVFYCWTMIKKALDIRG